MEITGKTVAVLDLVNGTSKAGNAYQKREFVIETAGQYPKKVCFQLFGDKVNKCPNVGDEVKVSFDAESREWQGRYYTQLNAWEVVRQGNSDPQPQSATPTLDSMGLQGHQQDPFAQTASQEVDDLPF